MRKRHRVSHRFIVPDGLIDKVLPTPTAGLANKPVHGARRRKAGILRVPKGGLWMERIRVLVGLRTIEAGPVRNNLLAAHLITKARAIVPIAVQPCRFSLCAKNALRSFRQPRE